MPILVRKNYHFCILRPWNYPSGYNSIFAAFSFRVRYGTPQLRGLRNTTVNLYRRPPPRHWLRIARRSASPILQYRASQPGPFLVQERRRFVGARENQCVYTNGCGIFGSIFGPPGADQASSFLIALHDFDESCTRFLVSANTRGWRVRTGGPA